VKNQNNEKLYSNISNNIPQMEDDYPNPSMCTMCPFVYMIWMMGMNPYQHMVEETSLYLNPLIED